MKYINCTINKFINEYGIPIEDATMGLPIAYHSMMADKRNFRSIVDMTAQRTCVRAYWEYRMELMNDYLKALRQYSSEWDTLINMTCTPKCERVGFCTEKRSCGYMPHKEEVMNERS